MRRIAMLARGACTVLLLAAVVTGMPAGAAAQLPADPPLRATLLFKNAPPNVTFSASSAATPVTIVLQVENASGSPILTTERFSATEFWRRLFFTDPAGGTVVNLEEAAVHGDAAHRHCLSRGRQLLRPTAVPVVPVEVLPAAFVLEYEIPDARQRFDLSRPGRYVVEARIPLLTFTTGDSTSVITDCDQFRNRTVVNVGPRAGTGRASFLVLSNRLEFVIDNPAQPPPSTTVQRATPPNSAGWDSQNVTLTFAGSATAERLVVTAEGSQAAELVFTRQGSDPPTGSLVIDVEGATTATVRAEDSVGTAETPQAVLVRLDKTPPVVTLSPPGGTFLPNQQITVQFAADDPSPPRGAPSGVAVVAATLTRPDGSVGSIASGTPITLAPGPTEVKVNALDTAGNVANPAIARYVVQYTFVGFGAPVGSDAACAPSVPCRTFRLGSTVPVKFQLVVNGVAVPTAVGHIAVVQVAGTPPAQELLDLGTGSGDSGNRFRYDPKDQQYIFNLDTRVLSRGTWRIDARLDDGTTHTVHIGLR